MVDIVILKSRAFYIMATLLLRQAQVSGDFCYIVVLLRTIYIDQHEHLKFENKKKITFTLLVITSVSLTRSIAMYCLTDTGLQVFPIIL